MLRKALASCKIILQVYDAQSALKFLSLLCLILIQLSANAIAIQNPQPEKTYFEWDKIKCTDANSPDCFNQIKCNLTKNYLKYGHYLTGIDATDCALAANSIFYSNSSFDSAINMNKEVSPVTFVTLHGLWGSRKQFSDIINHLQRVTHFQNASLEITLPGHSIDYDKQFLSAQYSEWIIALENTLKIAKQIGKKTVLIGQSTGGLLAVIAAIQYPDLVDSIVLIEPALEVNSLIDFGACASKYVPNNLIRQAGHLININLPPSVDVSMGCEVQKLADLYFPRKYFRKNVGPRGDSVFIQDMGSYELLAQKVKVPTLIINNVKDKIVSTSAIKSFFKGLKVSKKYFEVNTNGEQEHGQYTNNESANTFIISNFIYKNFKEESFRAVFNTNLGYAIESTINFACNTVYYQEERVCATGYIPFINSNQNIDKHMICDYLSEDPEFDCRRYLEYSENIRTFWNGFWSDNKRVVAFDEKLKRNSPLEIPSYYRKRGQLDFESYLNSDEMYLKQQYDYINYFVNKLFSKAEKP